MKRAPSITGYKITISLKYSFILSHFLCFLKPIRQSGHINQIREAKSAKTLRTLQLRFEKYDLVICDEFGYVSCDKEGGELLFNHLSLRAGKKATIITTNLAFNRWNEIIKDKVLVAAMVDRLTHKAYLVNMTGLSYRLKETQKMRQDK